MNQQMNMGVMGNIGGPPMASVGTPGNAAVGNLANGTHIRLNTYIYDYFLKNQHYDLARALQNTIEIDPLRKNTPDRKVNGTDSMMDTDNKDNVHDKPDDLPAPNIPDNFEGAFLFDWWCQFWDLYSAQRNKGAMPATKQYLNQVQARAVNERQRLMRSMDPQQVQGNVNLRNAMMANTMNNQQKVAVMQANNRQPTPQQFQQLQHHLRIQAAQAQQHQQAQHQMMQHTQMQREGSNMDMGQRPPSPGSGELAPSPKRQRLDGSSFNGQIGPGQMGPMGRGQPQGVQPQQFNQLQQMQTPTLQTKSMQVYASSMRQQMQTALDSDNQKGMPNPQALPQGSPSSMEPGAEFFVNNNNNNNNNGAQMRGSMPVAGSVPGGPNNSNHALQDYQMQLMLLEQQNKKRLLMARQEQDNMTNGPGVPIAPGAPGYPPAMSPSGSRAGGPSPGPDEQMKRGTPKLAPGGIPQPGLDGSMPQGRASPVPGFDPNQMNHNMAHNMYSQMPKMGGMVGANGQMMQPPGSHAAFNGQMNGQQLTSQQLEMLTRQNGNRMANGNWQQGAPNMMQGGQPQQQPPNMTPNLRNAAMPPPPAPTNDAGRGTQPSSPQQVPAPPTPSQSNKPNPKAKKETKANKKGSQKKGATAATPISEEQPPTPTPAPPITPTAPPFGKNGQGLNGQQQQQPPLPPPAQNAMPGQMPQPDIGPPFGNGLDDNSFAGMNLDFGGMDGQDVLDNFDFDSFLNNDAGDATYGFDGSLGFGDGLEAGGDV